MSRAESEAFEAEVRRVVDAIYGTPGQVTNPTHFEGKERDGIVFGRRNIVAFETTGLATVEKAKKDGKKLAEICQSLRNQHPRMGVSGLFVTKHAPTADQVDVISEFGPDVSIISYADLKKEIVDSRDYLAKRENHRFGSAADPDADYEDAPDHFTQEYVSLDFTETSPNQRRIEIRNVDFVVDSLDQGRTIVLTGAFGAGKSMTAREVHRRLTRAHHLDPTKPFPVTLNLREHKGQSDPSEAIHRHCSIIGFGHPDEIVSAWKAGFVHLILDGFDEISTPATWRGDADAIKEVRRSAMSLLRNFIEAHNSGLPKERKNSSGIFILGRHNVFDSHDEMVEMLGLSEKKNVSFLKTDEFTNEQVAEYLNRRGVTEDLPEWFPRRPLLLGYLVSANFLDLIQGEIRTASPTTGWDYLLDKIAARESLLEDGFTALLVRQVIERLASLSRLRGYVQQSDLARVYTEITNREPSDTVFHVLQRLPGLGAMDSAEGNRQFIDEDLASAAMAGDLAVGIQSRIFPSVFKDENLAPAPDLAIHLASEKLKDFTTENILQIGRSAIREGYSGALAFDILQIGMSAGPAPSSTDSYAITSTHFPYLESTLGEGDLSWIWFHDCLIETLEVPRSLALSDAPRFQSCAITKLVGLPWSADLVETIFHDTTVERVTDTTITTSSLISDASLEANDRIALTILKKIYAQTGSGRRIEALTRGVGKEHKNRAAKIAEQLVKSGFIAIVRSGNQRLAVPVRSQKAKVLEVLNGVTSLADLDVNLDRI